MSGISVTEASRPQKWLAGVLVAVYAIVTILPLVWIISTSFKSPTDAIAYPPEVLFQLALEGYVNLFTTQTRQSEAALAANPLQTWYDEIVHDRGIAIVGPSRFGERFMNSVIIGFGSTFLSVFMPSAATGSRSRTTCCSSSSRPG